MTSDEARPGTLFVVATPLGHLDDLSARAVRVLRSVELVACEDTRHTRKLLNHFGIATRTLSYHEHNEAERTVRLIRTLEKGADVALVSDAGTPLVSDPGFRLVRECRQRGLTVRPVPGPSAVTAALSVSGLPPDRFLFVGFLPRTRPRRLKELENLKTAQASLVFFIPPHSLTDQLVDLRKVLGDRRAFLAKELTKIHERHWWGTLKEIKDGQEEAPRGEYTLIVEGSGVPAEAASGIDLPAYVEGLQQTRGLTGKEAIRQAARDLGTSRNRVYREVALKKKRRNSF